MNKRDNIKIYLLALVVIFASSCSKFLEETPDNRLRLDSYEKIAELVTKAYPEGAYIFTETMTDNVGPAKTDEFRPITEAYKWEDVTSVSQDSPTYFWNSSYSAIAHANQALDALDALEVIDASRANAIRGEALACRAYSHFMLVNIFAKHYDATTASSDLGIVYVTKPEVTLLSDYKRISVAETYRLIEKDLQEALSLVTNLYYKDSGKYHFTREALYAFASRLYLYKGDMANCIKYSTDLLGTEVDNTFVRDLDAIYKGTSPTVMATNFTDPKVKSNLLLHRYEVIRGYRTGTGYRFSNPIFNEILLSNDDLRFSQLYYGNGNRVALYAPKFDRTLFRRTSLTSNTGYPYVIAVAFRSEETILNRIEALYLTGTTESKALAVEYFDNYITTTYAGAVNFRGLYNYYESKNYELDKDGNYVLDENNEKIPILNEKDLMIKLILDERRREFIEEGLRWFDIKRYDLTVVHIDVDGKTHTLTEKDLRKVVQIPTDAISIADLEPNPTTKDTNSEMEQPVLTNKNMEL